MISKTAIGAIISIVVLVFNQFGIVFPEGAETSLVEALTTLAGIVMLVWGQLSRKDLSMGLIRKN
ncbi:hypothetical protein [Bradyrhizobium sp. AUGA SZCCT0431]|uniref:hypothetical protein n=1 Tax=Bradyrhizobium sp. AUGA SZCCT0431 TaxID=2807674 RepID=UPI001BAE1C3F|nr:hypothetical protein [Bradyrhizobium sp. AUGA SZCCT0431]MBR1146667.1 hypothetical protein [Bradyrhizobium sp. AUGA SZCCT0431]